MRCTAKAAVRRWGRMGPAMGAALCGLAVSASGWAQEAALPESLARFAAAQAMLDRGDRDGARREYAAIVAMEDAPDHHRWEARQRLAELKGGEPHGAVSPEHPQAVRVPEVEAAVVFHVAPRGSDDGPGTADRPFATLERARDAVRRLKQQGPLPKGGVAISIAPGRYVVRQTFVLTEEDSGTANSPIVYRAAGPERPVFSGGVRLEGFVRVTDPELLARFPEAARGKVYQVDLGAAGLERIEPLVLGGFGSGRGFRTHPVLELFFDGQPMPRARWPNAGFVRVAAVTEDEPVESHGRTGSRRGVLYYQGDRPARWVEEPEVWLYGYWFWNWADSYEKVRSVDPERRRIVLEPPYHRYGYRAGQPFYAVNLLCEIDMPGEWCVDRRTGVLYFYPPADPDRARVELSRFHEVFVQLRGVSYVRFEGIVWELGQADGVRIEGGTDCQLAGCTLRCLGGDGVIISGGRQHGIISCDIHTLGRGGTMVNGGDRKTLAPARHQVENCHIWDLSRIDHTYTPAVWLGGVGNRLAHNLVHDIRSSAFRVGGNEHLIELNEVFRVVLESDDQGAVDMYGNPTYRGVVYRYNYFHHIGGWEDPAEEPPLGRAGIRLDDAISGVLVYGNVFYRASSGRIGFGGVQIHGGKDNIVDNNLFIDCWAAISFSPWGQARWQSRVAGALDQPDIDKALYLRRYPELAQLSENHDRNWIYRNMAYRCGTFLHRNARWSAVGQNVVVDQNPGIEQREPGTFRLKSDGAIWKEIGFRPIPLDRIGLYRDRFRRALPEQCVRQGRAAGGPVP